MRVGLGPVWVAYRGGGGWCNGGGGVGIQFGSREGVEKQGMRHAPGTFINYGIADWLEREGLVQETEDVKDFAVFVPLLSPNKIDATNLSAVIEYTPFDFSKTNEGAAAS